MTHLAPLADSFGRRINYLRISLTDQCNFRCVYCMPPEGVPTLRKSECLTQDEIVRFARIASRLGIEKIRLTGGEPLLRQDLLEIVRELKKIEAIRDLSITTNGSRLKPFIKSLNEAGLDRINISLDSLDFSSFKKITLSNLFEEVAEAVLLCLKEGLPTKLNVVVLKGLNDRQILDFARLACEYPLEVRFLEFMPLCGPNWQGKYFKPIGEIRSQVEAHYELDPEPDRNENVAQTFKIRGGRGRVGFIAPLTEPFCNLCSRIRLSADGRIRPCLFSAQEISVKEILLSNAPDEALMEALRQAVKQKPRGGPFHERPHHALDELAISSLSTPMIRSIGG